MEAWIGESGRIHIALDPSNREFEAVLAPIWLKRILDLYFPDQEIDKKGRLLSREWTEAKRLNELFAAVAVADSKRHGSKGASAKHTKGEGPKIAKQVAAALIFSVSTTNGKLDFGQFVYDATNLRNPSDGWKGYLLPGFHIVVEALVAGQKEQVLASTDPLVSKMTKSEAASAQERLSRIGASEDATQLKRVRDILNAYRARDFVRSSEVEALRENILSGLTAFEEWLRSQKVDYTQQADEVKILLRKLSA